MFLLILLGILLMVSIIANELKLLYHSIIGGGAAPPTLPHTAAGLPPCPTATPSLVEPFDI